MNLEQLRDASRRRLGVPSADAFFTDPILDDLVNESLQVLSMEEDWPWLQVATTFATVSGTRGYTPPAGWNRTKALGIDGYDALQWRSLQEIREVPTATTGVPQYYTVFAEQVLLAPIPNGVYTILHDYVKIEPDLTLATDTPLIPTQFHHAVVAYVAHLAHLRAGDAQMASAALADYQGWLSRMRNHRRRSSAPLRVRVRPGGGFM